MHEELVQRAGAEVGGLLAEDHLLIDGRRRDDVPGADARRDDLGERTQVDDVVIPIHAEERGNGLSGKAQEAVRVVLDYQQISLCGEIDQPPPALERECRTRGVAEVGDHVEELGPPPLGFKRIEHLSDGLHHQAVRVHGQMPHVRLIGGEGGERTRVRRALGQHDVAGVDERLGDQVDALLGPSGYEHVGGSMAVPSSSKIVAMSSFTKSKPSVGPYCRERARSLAPM